MFISDYCFIFSILVLILFLEVYKTKRQVKKFKNEFIILKNEIKSSLNKMHYYRRELKKALLVKNKTMIHLINKDFNDESKLLNERMENWHNFINSYTTTRKHFTFTFFKPDEIEQFDKLLSNLLISYKSRYKSKF